MPSFFVPKIPERHNPRAFDISIMTEAYMSFIGQAASVFGNLAEIKFQIVMFGRDGIYLEGVRPLKIDADEMIFRARDCVVTVSGEKLDVKELTSDCISVVGRIDGVRVSEQ